KEGEVIFGFQVEANQVFLGRPVETGRSQVFEAWSGKGYTLHPRLRKGVELQKKGQPRRTEQQIAEVVGYGIPAFQCRLLDAKGPKGSKQRGRIRKEMDPPLPLEASQET